MKIVVLTLVLGLFFVAETQASFRGSLLVWDPDTETYVQPTPGQARMLRAAKARGLSDEALQNALKIDPQTGVVTNSMATDYKLELGTFAAYISGVNQVKVGPYATIYRINNKFKLTLDVADSFVGSSIRYDVTEMLRPSVGVGVGCPLDGSWKVYFSVSFRLW